MCLSLVLIATYILLLAPHIAPICLRHYATLVCSNFSKKFNCIYNSICVINNVDIDSPQGRLELHMRGVAGSFER